MPVRASLSFFRREDVWAAKKHQEAMNEVPVRSRERATMSRTMLLCQAAASSGKIEHERRGFIRGSAIVLTLLRGSLATRKTSVGHASMISEPWMVHLTNFHQLQNCRKNHGGTFDADVSGAK